MSSTAKEGSILLTGGTGKIASRIAPLLSSNGYSVLLGSRSGNSPASLPNCQGVKFDWFDPATYTRPFESGPVSAVFLVAPPIMDSLPPMKAFIELAMSKGAQRFVLLSASLLEAGDGPAQAQVSNYIKSLNVEFAILRPTWFMENFSEQQHLPSIRDQDRIITATGSGKVPFVSADDIAAVAYRTLTDEKSHNTDHVILGPELFSYDEVAEILTKALGRKISHLSITENEAARGMEQWGIPAAYARMLAQLDTAIKNGEEDRVNDEILKVTGRPPRKLNDFVLECVKKGIWEKK